MKRLMTIVFALQLSTQVWASTDPGQKGLEIAKKIDQANQGFVGEESTMDLIIIDALGRKIERIMQAKVKEITGDGDKSINTVIKPADVKGTKTLTYSHKEGDDDQWIYLPSNKRVKKLSSSNQTGSFLGSEFSYEDLGSQEIEKYTYKYLGEQKDGQGKLLWQLERYPLNKNSGYKKQISYIDPENLTTHKVEYFNRRGDLLKVAIFEDFKTYKVGEKTLHRSHKISMENKLTKKKSILTWNDRKIGVSLPDNIFSKEGLSDE